MHMEHVETFTVGPIFLFHLKNRVETVKVGFVRMFHVAKLVEATSSQKGNSRPGHRISEHVTALAV